MSKYGELSFDIARGIKNQAESAEPNDERRTRECFLRFPMGKWTQSEAFSGSENGATKGAESVALGKSWYKTPYRASCQTHRNRNDKSATVHNAAASQAMELRTTRFIFRLYRADGYAKHVITPSRETG